MVRADGFVNAPAHGFHFGACIFASRPRDGTNWDSKLYGR